MIDFFKIPRENGDCVVLLLVHPGLNLLGRYLPPSKVNDLLLADISRVRSASHVDAYMLGTEDADVAEEMEAFDIMDLASFLEYVQNIPTTYHHVTYVFSDFQYKLRIAWKLCISEVHPFAINLPTDRP
jgi:hypothetical protein